MRPIRAGMLSTLALVACGTDLGDVEARLDDLEAGAADVGEALDAQQTLLDEAGEDVDALQDGVSGLDDRAEAAEEALGVLGDRVEALEAPRRRKVTLSARGLAYDPASVHVHAEALGLVFEATYQASAWVSLTAPEDYAGGDVVLSLTYLTTGAERGVIQFFARPRSFTSGDRWVDGNPATLTGVTATGLANTFYTDTVTLPGSTLTEPIWYITLQRGGGSETFPGEVTLLAAELIYDATP